MAPKRRLRSNTSLAVAASFDEDTLSDFQVVHSSTKNPVAPAPADQESGGSDSDNERAAGDEVESSDEIGENGVLTKRQPPPKRMAAAELAKKNMASVETSPLKSKTGKAAAPAAEISRSPPLTRNALAAQVARSPSPEKAATAAASEATKSPPPKNAAASEAAKSRLLKKAEVAAANLPRPKKAAARTEVAGTPPPTGSTDETTDVAPSPEAAAPAGAERDVPQPREDEYEADERTAPYGRVGRLPQLPAGRTVAEKHFREKSQRYWYLWQIVLSLEKEHFLSFKGAYLKMDDIKASVLNTKLKKMCMQEMKQQLWWMDTNKEVFEVLVNLIE